MKNVWKKSSKALALSLALVLGLAGCGSAGATGTVATTGESGTEDKTLDLKYSLTEELNSLDPNTNYSATSIGMIASCYEGLYAYQSDGTIGYGLASNVDISEDGCTYTFTIRDDAYWSNGTKVTSNDFYYSWRRLADPEMGCTYAYMLITAGVKNAMAVCYQGASLDDLGISCPDDSTFVVELDAPRSYFRDLLATGSYFMPINQEFCESCGDQFALDKDHTIYCGPFQMSEWEVGGTTYTLTKNPSYYDADRVTVDSIHYTLLTDSQQKILAWEKGELDQVQLTGDFIAMYASDPDLYTFGYPGLFFIAFNCEDPYFSNQNLRMAVSTAINKETIVNSILCDGSTVADYAIPADFAMDSSGVTFREHIGNPSYNTYDLTAAASYWEAAKAELGVDSIEVEFLYNEDSQLASVAAFIQSELQTNLPGMTVTLRQTSYNQRLTDMSNGDYQFGITRWYADYQDASTYLDMWIESSNLNYENWYDEEYNDLYSQVVGELALDEEARIAAQARMEEIFMEDAAICPLYQPVFVYLRNNDYTYVYTSSGGTVTRFTDWKE